MAANRRRFITRTVFGALGLASVMSVTVCCGCGPKKAEEDKSGDSTKSKEMGQKSGEMMEKMMKGKGRQSQ